MRAYIPSYFGEKHRDERIEVHNQQLDWLMRLKVPTTILSMGYRRGDYYNNDLIEYVDHDRLPPTFARNELFTLFYNRQDPWGMFIDNDCIIYPHGMWEAAFAKIRKLKFNPHVHLIKPINPMEQPFRKEINYTNDILDNQLVFIKNLNLKGSMFFMQNIKLSHGREIYHDPEEELAEDSTLPLEFAINGFGAYVCKNIAIKELSKHSVYLEMNGKTRQECQRIIYDYCVEKYPGVVYDANGRVNRKYIRFDHPNALILNDSGELKTIVWANKQYRQYMRGTKMKTLF